MPNRLDTLTIFVAASILSTAGNAEELPIPADELVYCTVCHGVQLMGNEMINAPRLSGMETWYVERQLRNFSAGIRGLHEGDEFGVDMQPMAAALTDEQIVEAAQFTNATRSPAAAVTVTGDTNRGQALYASCAACHGPDGKGNEALGAPDLTTANDWYLITQIKNFRSGARGSKAGDIYGMQMRASVQLLADDEAIRDVVSYISTFDNKRGRAQ